jgi:hypothetical protein
MKVSRSAGVNAPPRTQVRIKPAEELGWRAPTDRACGEDLHVQQVERCPSFHSARRGVGAVSLRTSFPTTTARLSESTMAWWPLFP